MLHIPNVPGRELVATPAAAGLAYQDVTLITADHLRLHGWFVPAAQAGRTVLFFHGNAGNISHRLESLQIFHRLGLATLIIDYRGYGRSEGSPAEAGLYQDAEAAWHYLTEHRGIPAQEIVVFGRSLGGAVAAWLAAHHAVGALIVESSFTSVPDRAAELYPWLPVRLLSRMNYDTRTNLQQVTCPVLIIHSPDDEIIPFQHGKRLLEAASEPKQWLVISGDHNSGFLHSGKHYENGIRDFLHSLSGEPESD
ncbi:MAG: alpha/beta hydrolase [Candidatus Competibacteraceae bacterium]|nr:alpha/beta hydrolase [Candidatus Competibacteraceae bacterium]